MKKARTKVIRVAIALVLVVAVSGLAAATWAAQVGDLEPVEGATGFVGSGELQDLRFTVSVDGTISEGFNVRLDGEQVTEGVEIDEYHASFRPPPLEDGSHEVTMTLPRAVLPDKSYTWNFEVDTEPPSVDVVRPKRPAPAGRPVEVHLQLSEPAEVEVEGHEVEVDGDTAVLRLPEPSLAPLKIKVTDRAGNRTTTRETIAVKRKLPDPLRSVHVGAEAWVDPELKRGVIRLVRQRKINAIQLDLKDETGTIGYDSKIPLARQIKSSGKVYDLAEAVEEIHALGVPVIGRIVCFADPILARRSWASGHKDRVIQTPDGRPFAGMGGFTNFANPDVIRYNIDIAEEAARAGVDHILYDYVRRPDAALSQLRIPGLKGNSEKAVAEFVRRTKERLEPYGTLLGASVFGIASTRPGEISQNIPMIARHVDYIAPMIYPSHWGPGEYGVADPINQPYEIVRRSLPDFKQAVKGTDAAIVPWLQDFTLGVYYGPDRVAAQLKGSADVGIHSWILWDPFVTYTEQALPKMRKNQF